MFTIYFSCWQEFLILISFVARPNVWYKFIKYDRWGVCTHELDGASGGDQLHEFMEQTKVLKCSSLPLSLVLMPTPNIINNVNSNTKSSTKKKKKKKKKNPLSITMPFFLFNGLCEG